MDEQKNLGAQAMDRAAFALPRILIVGCGDVGQRAVPWLCRRFKVYALTRNPRQHERLRILGATPIPGDLDEPDSLYRIAGLADHVLHLAPPPNAGLRDTRTRHLLPRLGRIKSLVYVSTSGVYGDCAGAQIDETQRLDASTPRAKRRVDAETILRKWARQSHTRLAILRAPGIYAANRLPLARLSAGTPALIASDDVYTNHIHADDLARLVVTALFRGAALRVFNASDDSELKMGDYFDQVAQAFDLPAPPRLARDKLASVVGPQMLSFMNESRRLINQRVKAELGFRFDYPTTASGITAAVRTMQNDS